MNNPPPIKPSVLFLPLALSLGMLLALWVTWHHSRPLRPSAPSFVELNRTNLMRLQNHWCVLGQTNPFTGVMLEFYPGGARMSRSVISNGLLNGLSEGWFTNGQIQIQETYHDNLSDGLRTKWYPNGKKLSESAIVQGKLEGIFRHWHIDGSLAEEIPMHAGRQEGVGHAYYPSGYLAEEVEVRAGQVIHKATFKPGERKGL